MSHYSMVIAGALGVLILIGTIGLIFSTTDAAAFQGHRKPVPAPTGDPPVLPACPTDFEDDGCFKTGSGTDADFSTALGTAEQICTLSLLTCYEEQSKELEENRKKCEAVPGCKLAHTVTADTCDGTYLDCTPIVGEIGPFTCTVSGQYDIEGYSCSRPIVLPHPGMEPPPKGPSLPPVSGE
ncbi:MAG: hypothetical protein AABY11_03600 [archaeon]